MRWLGAWITCFMNSFIVFQASESTGSSWQNISMKERSATCRLSSADADVAACVRMHCLKTSAWLVEVVKSGDKYAGLSGQEKKGGYQGRQHNQSVGGRWMSAWVADAEMGSCLPPAPALTRIIYYVGAAGKVLHAFCASLDWVSVVMSEWMWWCGVGEGVLLLSLVVGYCRCKYKCLSADSPEPWKVLSFRSWVGFDWMDKCKAQIMAMGTESVAL